MPTSLENQVNKLRAVDHLLPTTIFEALPTFTRAEESKKIRHEYSVRALVAEILAIYQDCPSLVIETLPKIEAAATTSIGVISELIVAPPTGLDVCARNPRYELPQLERLLFASLFTGKPLLVVVPCCPDTDQYVLKDGLGDVVPKALKYIQTMRKLCDRHHVSAQFDIQVADVEGLDPVILKNSGETTESHFQKTGETIRKTRYEIAKHEYQNVTVSSMNKAFTAKGLDYLELQNQAAHQITTTANQRTENVVQALLKERRKLGNFDHISLDNQHQLVVHELAGYAAYGELINGEAVILSPDALSAIPAYHFTVQQPYQFSPVLYAK